MKLINILVAFLQIVGGTGQGLILPMWIDYLHNSAPYFVLVFASFAFVVIFGLIMIFYAVFFPRKLFNHQRSNEYEHPILLNRQVHKNMFLNGFCDSMNGIFAVFSSPASRVSLPIQSSLSISLIPITILVRYLFLKKKPNTFQTMSIVVILTGLIITMIPTIKDYDASGINGRGNETLTKRIMWPCLFIFAFVPAAIMNVLGESVLKKNQSINVIVFLFWTSLYQLMTDLVFFGVDLIPHFGNSKNINAFGQHIINGLKDTFNTDNVTPACLALLFITFYIIAYLGTYMLIRNDEGATWSAVVGTFATPLSVLFWFLFQEKPFKFKPHFPKYGWYIICGSVILTVASLVYKKCSSHKDDDDDDEEEQKNRYQEIQ